MWIEFSCNKQVNSSASCIRFPRFKAWICFRLSLIPKAIRWTVFVCMVYKLWSLTTFISVFITAVMKHSPFLLPLNIETYCKYNQIKPWWSQGFLAQDCIRHFIYLDAYIQTMQYDISVLYLSAFICSIWLQQLQ